MVYKKCILIGGAGFMGMNLAKRLLSEGYKVTIVDKSLSPFPTDSKIINNLSFYQVDYRNSDKLISIIKNQDILFHLACFSLPGTSFDKMDDDVKDNVLGSIRLFRLAVENGVREIIFPSSGGTVYGNSHKLPIKEYFATNPICFYGITKLMTEKYLFLFNRLFGMDFLIYRISNLYGPGQNPNGEQGLIANVIGKIYKGLPITIFGDGENVRDYIYIEDVIDAFLLAIKNGLKNDVFNIGTGKGYSINEVINIASKIVCAKPKIIYFDRRLVDVQANILNCKKVESAIDWKAKVPIEEGMQNTYHWIRKVFS